MNIRQPELPPLEQICQPLMINPQQMQNRRLQIMYVHPALGYVEPIIVRSPVRKSTLHPAPRHPQRKHPAMMIPAIRIRLRRPLRIRRPAKLFRAGQS